MSFLDLDCADGKGSGRSRGARIALRVEDKVVLDIRVAEKDGLALQVVREGFWRGLGGREQRQAKDQVSRAE
jgi:hypothetical protein